MSNNRFEELPPNHIAPVFDFYTGLRMEPNDIASLKWNARNVFKLGVAKRVISTEDVPFPEGVVSLDDVRRERLVQELTSHRAQPCLTKTYANPGLYSNDDVLPAQPQPLRLLRDAVFKLFVVQD